eukprot:gene13461-18057_t
MRQNDPNSKWPLSTDSVDHTIPPQIARLTGGSVGAYNTFIRSNNENDRLLSNDMIAEDFGEDYDDLASVYQQRSIEPIKDSIMALRPYFRKRNKYKSLYIDALEIYPSGESGYKYTKTLTEMLSYIREEVNKIDEQYYNNLVQSQEESRRYSQSSVHNVRLHDLQHLVHRFNPHEEPVIIVRRHLIIISFNPIRAVVMANKLIFIVPQGSESLLLLLQEHLNAVVEGEDKERVGENVSTELRYICSLLSTVVALHELELSSIANKVDKTLTAFNSVKNINVEMQEHSRVLKNIVSDQYSKIRSYNKLFDKILQNHELCFLMNLSVLKSSSDLYAFDSAELGSQNRRNPEFEILLESYSMEYNVQEGKLHRMQNQMQNSEEMISLRLDTRRNELLIIDISLNTIMAVTACATFFTSLFGMNLTSGLESSDFIFWALFFILSASVAFMMWFLLYYFKITGSSPNISLALLKNSQSSY